MEPTIQSLTSKESVIDFISDYTDFSAPDGEPYVYQLILMARERENEGITHNSQIAFSEIITDTDTISRKVEKLWTLAEQYHPPDYHQNPTFRLYITANRRDVQTAEHHFVIERQKLHQNVHNGHTESQNKISRLDSVWKHILQSSGSKGGKKFIIDIDEPSEDVVREIVPQLKRVTTVECVVESPNGYHVITDSYAYPRHEDIFGEYDVEVKTDDLLFVTMI